MPWGEKKIKRNDDGSDVGHLMPIILGIQLMQQLCVLRFRSESLIIIRAAVAPGPSALRPGTKQAASSNSKVLPILFFLQSPDILFHSDCNLCVRTVVTLAPNRPLKFKRSPPSLPNTPNAALNEAILFIGAVGGLWVTLCPFKKDNMLPI